MGIMRGKARNAYLRDMPVIQRWIRNLNTVDTETSYLDDFRYFLDWIAAGDSKFKDFSPAELIAYQKKHRNYEIVDLMLDYLHDVKEDLTTGTVTRRDSVIKSFFRSNRAALPDDVYNIKGGRVSTPGSLTRDELKRVILASNPVYRAIFACMYAGFMGYNEYEHWNNTGYPELREQIENGDLIVVAWQDGRKQYAGIPFYNLIGGDALNLLKIYLDEHRKPGDRFIFKSKRDNPINYSTLRTYWIRKLKKLGIIDPKKDPNTPGKRYGKGLHEIRDLARTEWSKSPAKPTIAEFMLGHKSQLDPNEYDKAIRDLGFSKREYRKALPRLNILTQDPNVIPVEKYERDLSQFQDYARKIDQIDAVLKHPVLGKELINKLDEIYRQVKE
ncbi:MAG: hypothetical protein ACTSW1_10745 [Candidatus Hodarchaeales archaeon]